MSNTHFTPPGGGSGSGDATASNQLLEIGQLIAANFKLADIYNTVGSILVESVFSNTVIENSLSGNNYIKYGSVVRNANVALGGNFTIPNNRGMVIGIVSQATKLPIALATATATPTTGFSEFEEDLIANQVAIGHLEYLTLPTETVNRYAPNAKTIFNMLLPVRVYYLELS